MLTLPQIKDVCMTWQGYEQCRYLNHDASSGNSYCVKKVPGRKAIYDDQVKKFVANAKANGQDPKALGRPLGDNCRGYPPLKLVKQGYDIDGGP